MYSRSPAAYEALKSFKLVQLPSIRTLKYYVDANLENAGDSTSRIIQSRKEYIAMIEEMAKEKADKISDPGKLMFSLIRLHVLLCVYVHTVMLQIKKYCYHCLKEH